MTIKEMGFGLIKICEIFFVGQNVNSSEISKYISSNKFRSFFDGKMSLGLFSYPVVIT